MDTNRSLLHLILSNPKPPTANQTHQASLALLSLGALFYLLGFFVALPVILVRPAKFAICATMGSVLCLVRARVYLCLYTTRRSTTHTYTHVHPKTGERLSAGGALGAPAEPHETVSTYMCS